MRLYVEDSVIGRICGLISTRHKENRVGGLTIEAGAIEWIGDDGWHHLQADGSLVVTVEIDPHSLIEGKPNIVTR